MSTDEKKETSIKLTSSCNAPDDTDCDIEKVGFYTKFLGESK